MATLCVDRTLAPREKESVRFVLSWYIPRRIADWTPYPGDGTVDTPWKNYYAVPRQSASEVAAISLERWDELFRRTDAFRRALFASSLDPIVIEAAAANLSTLKTATCLRLEDGSFWGWEGLKETVGSCPGTTAHVWIYSYALPFLFPDLQRSIRNLEYKYVQFEDGSLAFRVLLPLRPSVRRLPCVDGQFGGIMCVYREWKLSGNTEWLRSIWPNIKRALEYAWLPDSTFAWDKNKDGVLEGRQHHTLDMELFGPSSWLEGYYLGALKAAAEMAEVMGEPESAAEYRELFAKGSAWMEENLFNGEWYAQKVDLTDRACVEGFGAPAYWNTEAGEIKYQIGDGCEIDQMNAQWHAHLMGLGALYDPAHCKIALNSLLKYNYVSSFRDFTNPWRLYGLNDESGVVMCTWPKGTYQPVIPLPYNSESMHGFEYQLAGLSLAEGRTEDALKIVRSIRAHYVGHNRNPYNEIECGSNYARSMASWALIPLFSGFTYDMTRGEIGFEPKRQSGETFSTIWSVDGVWGTILQDDHSFTLEKCDGNAAITLVKLPFLSANATVTAVGGEAEVVEGGIRVTHEVRSFTVSY